MYIVLNNYFRRKSYHYSPQIPYDWAIRKTTPDSLKRLKYYCGSRHCSGCEFETKSETRCCLATAAAKY